MNRISQILLAIFVMLLLSQANAIASGWEGVVTGFVGAMEESGGLNNSRTQPQEDAYLIQDAHNDVDFIINGRKFTARAYCKMWQKGEAVVFLSGSPDGFCESAELYNLNRKLTCGVWCK